VTSVLAVAAHVAALLVLPIFVVGLVNRTKSMWAGRRGPSLHQTAFDLARLLRKRPVQSSVATWFVPYGPVVLLASTFVAGLLVPLASGWAPLAGPWDLVAFAYLLGLGRLALVLAAMDTGSAFEGMGASREAQYATLVEPALFLAVGSLAALSGRTSFADVLAQGAPGPWGLAAEAGALVALVVLLQVEAARVPIDDPQTHLELTMIHEVMVLDHAGPDLAAVQYAAAMKLTICAAAVAALLHPIATAGSPLLAILTSAALLALVAVGVGLIESLVARLRLRAVPRYLLAGLAGGLVAVLTLVLAQGRIA
jgi:formate hydrogenlyase subunit 4